ncbi:hypothetical protein EG329_007624 [Mollisiaceae sp. DMI_Dod_QoI]|nr:hypothetical protein EG329_007624 [Helotiales sp. DMI_Dod_QoI]
MSPLKASSILREMGITDEYEMYKTVVLAETLMAWTEEEEEDQMEVEEGDASSSSISLPLPSPVAPAKMESKEIAAALSRLETTSNAPSGTRSLRDEYKRLNKKHGSKVFQRPCPGAAKCSNLLCDHRLAPAGSLSGPSTMANQKLLTLLMKKCEADQYPVSVAFASHHLLANDSKLVPALLHIKAEIDTRERRLHNTGRLSVPYERVAHYQLMESLTYFGEEVGTRMPTTRDEILRSFEDEEKMLLSTDKNAAKKLFGLSSNSKAAKKEGEEYARALHSGEKKYREARAKHWVEIKKDKTLSDMEVELCMQEWENQHSAAGSFGRPSSGVGCAYRRVHTRPVPMVPGAVGGGPEITKLSITPLPDGNTLVEIQETGISPEQIAAGDLARKHLEQQAMVKDKAVKSATSTSTVQQPSVQQPSAKQPSVQPSSGDLFQLMYSAEPSIGKHFPPIPMLQNYHAVRQRSDQQLAMKPESSALTSIPQTVEEVQSFLAQNEVNEHNIRERAKEVHGQIMNEYNRVSINRDRFSKEKVQDWHNKFTIVKLRELAKKLTKENNELRHKNANLRAEQVEKLLDDETEHEYEEDVLDELMEMDLGDLLTWFHDDEYVDELSNIQAENGEPVTDAYGRELTMKIHVMVLCIKMQCMLASMSDRDLGVYSAAKEELAGLAPYGVFKNACGRIIENFGGKENISDTALMGLRVALAMSILLESRLRFMAEQPYIPEPGEATAVYNQLQSMLQVRIQVHREELDALLDEYDKNPEAATRNGDPELAWELDQNFTNDISSHFNGRRPRRYMTDETLNYYDETRGLAKMLSMKATPRLEGPQPGTTAFRQRVVNELPPNDDASYTSIESQVKEHSTTLYEIGTYAVLLNERVDLPETNAYIVDRLSAKLMEDAYLEASDRFAKDSVETHDPHVIAQELLRDTIAEICKEIGLKKILAFKFTNIAPEEEETDNVVAMTKLSVRNISKGKATADNLKKALLIHKVDNKILTGPATQTWGVKFKLTHFDFLTREEYNGQIAFRNETHELSKLGEEGKKTLKERFQSLNRQKQLREEEEKLDKIQKASSYGSPESLSKDSASSSSLPDSVSNVTDLDKPLPPIPVPRSLPPLPLTAVKNPIEQEQAETLEQQWKDENEMLKSLPSDAVAIGFSSATAFDDDDSSWLPRIPLIPLGDAIDAEALGKKYFYARAHPEVAKGDIYIPIDMGNQMVRRGTDDDECEPGLQETMEPATATSNINASLADSVPAIDVNAQEMLNDAIKKAIKTKTAVDLQIPKSVGSQDILSGLQGFGKAVVSQNLPVTTEVVQPPANAKNTGKAAEIAEVGPSSLPQTKIDSKGKSRAVDDEDINEVPKYMYRNATVEDAEDDVEEDAELQEAIAQSLARMKIDINDSQAGPSRRSDSMVEVEDVKGKGKSDEEKDQITVDDDAVTGFKPAPISDDPPTVPLPDEVKKILLQWNNQLQGEKTKLTDAKTIYAGREYMIYDARPCNPAIKDSEGNVDRETYQLHQKLDEMNWTMFKGDVFMDEVSREDINHVKMVGGVKTMAWARTLVALCAGSAALAVEFHQMAYEEVRMYIEKRGLVQDSYKNPGPLKGDAELLRWGTRLLECRLANEIERATRIRGEAQYRELQMDAANQGYHELPPDVPKEPKKQSNKSKKIAAQRAKNGRR